MSRNTPRSPDRIRRAPRPRLQSKWRPGGSWAPKSLRSSSSRFAAWEWSAEQAVTGTEPQINDLVLRGYLISFDEGSATKRVAIGFGSGGSELKVAVEGFQMTAQGLRKLGSGTTASGGGKGPGTAMGVATLIATNNPAGLIISTGVKVYGEKSGSAKVEGRAKQTAKEIADVLKGRFKEEGWI